MLPVVKRKSTTPELVFEDLRSSNYYPSLLKTEWEDFSKDLYPTDPEVVKFFSEYDKFTTYVEKMKYLCEYSLCHLEDQVGAVIENLPDSDRIRQHFLGLGPEKIIATGYNLTKINKALGIKVFDKGKLDCSILEFFKVGERYTNANCKSLIANLFQGVGYKGTAKASVLQEYFIIKTTKVTINKVATNGIEILDVKPEYQNLYNQIHAKEI